jgi:hypothetical protein
MRPGPYRVGSWDAARAPKARSDLLALAVSTAIATIASCTCARAIEAGANRNGTPFRQSADRPQVTGPTPRQVARFVGVLGLAGRIVAPTRWAAGSRHACMGSRMPAGSPRGRGGHFLRAVSIWGARLSWFAASKRASNCGGCAGKALSEAVRALILYNDARSGRGKSSTARPHPQRRRLLIGHAINWRGWARCSMAGRSKGVGCIT